MEEKLNKAVNKRLTELSSDIRKVSNKIVMSHDINERTALENLRQLLLITHLTLRNRK